MKNQHLGSDFDNFLREDDLLEATTAVALKRVLAFQIAKEMKRHKITKAAMTRRMQTDRTVLDGLLDPSNASVTLHTLERAASALGKTLKVELA
jgi:antitoxin HicB